MKHFVIYRKLILIIGTATAVVSVGVFFFMEDILFRTLFISFAFVFFGGLLFLLDFLHKPPYFYLSAQAAIAKKNA